jgi:branched-chain amino acid transport system substrate-binding protein
LALAGFSTRFDPTPDDDPPEEAFMRRLVPDALRPFRSAPLLLLAGLVVAGCGGGGGKTGGQSGGQAGAPAGEPIRIGHLAAMTGATANFGQSCDKGARMAMQEINEKGGVLGRPLALLTEDDRSLPTEARTSAIKLIEQHVAAIIGEVASSNSIAAAPEAQKAQVPMVSPASTNPEVTEKGDYIFRICFIDPFQGEVMAKFGYNSLGKKSAAILTDVKAAYSVGLAQFFKQTFTQLGGTITAEEAYSQGDIEFKAQLTKIKGTNPEILFVPGYYNEVGLIARQARELGMTAVILGGDGWDSPDLLEIGGAAIEGAYFSNHYASDDPNPVIQDFIAKYKAAHGEVPDAMAVLGYDVFRIVADAIGRAGSTEGPKVRDALAATKDFPGVSGTITIDPQRNARKDAVVIKIENGSLHFAERVKP